MISMMDPGSSGEQGKKGRGEKHFKMENSSAPR